MSLWCLALFDLLLPLLLPHLSTNEQLNVPALLGFYVAALVVLQDRTMAIGLMYSGKGSNIDGGKPLPMFAFI